LPFTFLKIANPFAQLECTEFTIWEGLRTLLVLLITWVIIAVVSALIAPSGGVGGGFHCGTFLLGKVLTTHLMQVAPNSKQSHLHLHKYEFSTYAKSELLVATQHSVFFFLF
jgi:hypothetical protein